ncbi:head-tail connector protein [Phyllobacterium sp. SB3]|uniref:head-tail connector protein n=1 Tax=Phyllobacterium sp. SB3 TaxID=3156073 RepID=UPI0032AF4174
MAIVTLEAMKAELGILDDVDDTMISAKIEESQAWLESFLGYAIADEYPDTVPADLVMAVKMQCAHMYENREATIAGVSIQLVPNGVDDIIANRRRYSFDGA